MSVNQIQVGDVGTVFTITIKDQSNTAVDISGATTKYFILQQPDGSVTTITANYVGSGTAGQIAFTSASSHFDQQGKYKLQAYVADTTTAWHTDVYTFSVSSNLG